MKYIVYLLTIVLPVKQNSSKISRHSRLNKTAYRVRETIELLERKNPDFISPDL